MLLSLPDKPCGFMLNVSAQSDIINDIIKLVVSFDVVVHITKMCLNEQLPIPIPPYMETEET